MSTPFVATPSWLRGAADVPAAVPVAASATLAADDPDAVAPGRVHVPAGAPSPFAADAAADRDADLAMLGPLAAYTAGATDLFVNGERGLWVDRGSGPRREPGWHADESEVRRLAVSLVARGGRHIDEATPAVDVRLGRGIRVHAVLPPVSSSGTLLSVRIPHARGFTLDALADGGMLARGELAMLRACIAERRNVLVTGGGGTGKTTLLGAMLREAPTHERIVVIEDVAELQIAHEHVVGLEARQPNLEGSGRIGLESLLREALRMRPDRIVVGECRGAELRELLAALNTGHDGGAGTLHANSLDDVPARLEALGAIAGLSADAVARQAVSAFDVVLHLERGPAGRRLTCAGRLVVDAGRLEVVPL